MVKKSDNDLPGSSLPLPPEVQDAIDEFNQPALKSKMIRTAMAALLFDDLKDEIRKMLKDRGL
jgi:hypothetical protein